MGGQGFHVRQADEVCRVGTEPLLLIVVLRTQRPGGCHPRPGTSRDRACPVTEPEPAGSPRRRQQPAVLQGQASLRQPPPAIQADPRLRRACCLASGGAADAPAQQRMPGIDRQHPGDRIPAGPGQERRVDPRGQHGRVLICRHRPRCAENIAGAARHVRPGSPLHGGCAHRLQHAHWSSPAVWRGLGTASTAARSRAGSGCAYTWVEVMLACPSRSCTSSSVPPASRTFEANACRI